MAYTGSSFNIRESLCRKVRLLANKGTAFFHSVLCLLYPGNLLDHAAAVFAQME
jgi:hypothetical protein